jgi:hypothetical protein
VKALPLRHHAVYGITLASDFPFSWPLVPSERPADVRFDCIHRPVAPPGEPIGKPVHAVAVSGDEDRPDIVYERLEGCDVVRVRDAAVHHVFPKRIECALPDPTLAYLAEIQLLGMVLALWLERRGVPTLHASSVVIRGRAVAFLGMKGGGKTTAATALVAAGHALLADDLLALRIDDAGVFAQPGYPMLRLWPEQADHFLGGHADLPLVHPSYDKRRVVVEPPFGRFHRFAAPLQRIYVPIRRMGGAISIEPLRSSDALIALVRESFLREAVHGLGLAAHRLGPLAQVLSTVDVRLLRYPDGFDRLPELVSAVETDLAGG